MLLNDDTEFQTPAQNNALKRVYTPISAFEFRSQKKRRISLSSPNATVGSPNSSSSTGPVFRFENASTPSLDRFIPLRPQAIVPLTISPRTNRMCKSFGLLRSQRLSYKDENTIPNPDPASASSAYGLLRKSASSLLTGPKSVNNRSVVQNLAKSQHATLVLDSPGLTTKPFSSPLSWSLDDRIAVACGRDVYYQDVATRKVTHFFKTGIAEPAEEAVFIAWGDKLHSTKLACINSNGACEVYAVESGVANLIHDTIYGDTHPEEDAKVLAWSGNTLACGLGGGDIRLYDLRDAVTRRVLGGQNQTGGHSRGVVSMTYDTTGNYLASGDSAGNVHIWDIRAHKSLTQVEKSSKIKHRAPPKALAWCTWKPDLLATGSVAPEGIIKVWSVNQVNHGPIEPEKSLSINAAVQSIIWSPHCKELLSVHGVQFKHKATTHRPRTASNSDPQRAASTSSVGTTTVVQGPLTNSILVHDYPSGKRLFTLTRAHQHSVTAASLSPNGQDVFTASPSEQTIKMWKVWGEPPKRERSTPFASCIIR